MSNAVAATVYTTPSELLLIELLTGVYSRVARQTGTSRSHVYRVMQGERTSPRIAAAFAKEMARIEREVAKLRRKERSVAA